MLTVGASSGLGPLDELNGPRRRAHEAAASRLWSTSRQAASSRSSAPPFDRSAAFHVQKLLAQDLDRGAPPPGRQVMLAAYRAHLAERIRYFGPLTPVDLRV